MSRPPVSPSIAGQRRERIVLLVAVPLVIATISCEASKRGSSPPSALSSAATENLPNDHRQAPTGASAHPSEGAAPRESEVTVPEETPIEQEPGAQALSPGKLFAAAQSANAFAFDLWGNFRKSPGNLVFSPISIVSALTMAAAGANGVTASEMKRVLHGNEGTPDPLADTGKLLASFQKLRGTSFHFGNRLFGDESYKFKAPYVDALRHAFGAPLEAVDFLSAPEPARAHINTWVEAQTEHRIRDLLPPGSVEKNTKLVLVNAITFKGNWSVEFSESETKLEPFRPSRAPAHDVLVMHTKAFFSFAAMDQARIIEMTYGGGDVAMVFVLPNAVDGLGAIEKITQPATLSRWIGALKNTYLEIALPRFEVSPAASVELRRPLEALGMPSAFDEQRADFTGMAIPPDPSRRLFLSNVFHKAFIKLDEKGTEASAATAVLTAETLSAQVRPEPVHVKLDHPFLFFLRDRRSGAILFMGRVDDPG